MVKTADAAGCVIFDEEGKVLLVHQTYGKCKWALPGGTVEDGESSWEAAVRECKEEIGVDITDLFLSGLYYLSHRNAYVHIFIAKGFSGTPTPDHKEIDSIAYFHRASFRHRCRILRFNVSETPLLITEPYSPESSTSQPMSSNNQRAGAAGEE